MSVVATVFAPDGSQIRHPKSGKPLVYERRDARRALLSAIKAWWPTDPVGKKGTGPTWGQPPVGARIDLDGQPWMRFEDVPVLDAAGEIVDVAPAWVDIAQRHRDEVKAAKIAAMKAAEAAKRAAAAAESASDTPEIPVLAPLAEDVTAPLAAGSAAIQSEERIVPPTSRRRG